MEEHKQFWGRVDIPFKKTEDEAWSDLQTRLSSAGGATVVPMRSAKWVWGAAAAAVVAFGFLMFALYPNKATLTALNGQITTHTLPDGSEVVLNAGSTIEYNTDWSENRSLELNGQAFFTVKKGSNFVVKTQNGQVRVLGTSFDVLSRGNTFDVYCETGVVEVSSLGIKKVITPGQAVKLKNGVFERKVPAGNLAEWKVGRFVYENESLDEVLNEMERQFNVVIKRPNVRSVSYTGEFKNTNLTNALEVVLAPFDLSFTKIDDRTIEVKENNR